MVSDTSVLVVNTFPECSYSVVTPPSKNYGNCRTPHLSLSQPDTLLSSRQHGSTLHLHISQVSLTFAIPIIDQPQLLSNYINYERVQHFR